ncbi:MAG: hypothetical protein RR405_00295 [Clostridia bacterium]
MSEITEMSVKQKKLAKQSVIGTTEIFVCSGENEWIANTLKDIIEGGVICVVCDKQNATIASDVIVCFKAAGFRIIAKDCGEIDSVPDYTRFIFAVGSEDSANSAKTLARRLDISWSLLWTSPNTDNILCDFAPKQVFIDENIMIKCRNEDIASGWGIVLSQPIKQFDEYFFERVVVGNVTSNDVNAKDCMLPQTASRVSLAVKLLELSQSKKSEDSAELMATLLFEKVKKQGEKPRQIGEYRFICSAVLYVFYSNFLGSPSIDILPPLSHTEMIDLTEKLTYACPDNIIKRIDFFDVNSYFRISYILSEYRMDLLERLSGCELHSAQRFWRRIYPDAGFWLKSALSARDILTVLALVGQFSGGLLGFAAATGFTDKFAKC